MKKTAVIFLCLMTVAAAAVFSGDKQGTAEMPGVSAGNSDKTPELTEQEKAEMITYLDLLENYDVLVQLDFLENYRPLFFNENKGSGGKY